MQSVVNGTVRPEIKLHICRPGGSPSDGLKAFSVWTLSNVIIDQYQISASEDGFPEENWAIAYVGIKHEYNETNQQSGKFEKEKENEFLWNLRTGRAEKFS